MINLSLIKLKERLIFQMVQEKIVILIIRSFNDIKRRQYP